MDESKKKEFERTVETYADSFLKADNPRLIYEIAYSQVSMSHGRPKPAPKEVVLDDDTAAEVLFKLVPIGYSDYGEPYYESCTIKGQDEKSKQNDKDITD